jgi:hypothetical protein
VTRRRAVSDGARLRFLSAWLPADDERWPAWLTDGDPAEVVFYSPTCAEREFGGVLAWGLAAFYLGHGLVSFAEGWAGIARDKERETYQDLIHENALQGWRLVQIFAPGIAAFGAAKYNELIFEREGVELPERATVEDFETALRA